MAEAWASRGVGRVDAASRGGYGTSQLLYLKSLKILAEIWEGAGHGVVFRVHVALSSVRVRARTAGVARSSEPAAGVSRCFFSVRASARDVAVRLVEWGAEGAGKRDGVSPD